MYALRGLYLLLLNGHVLCFFYTLLSSLLLYRVTSDYNKKNDYNKKSYHYHVLFYTRKESNTVAIAFDQQQTFISSIKRTGEKK